MILGLTYKMIIMILLASAITLGLRAFPFVIFSGGRQTPATLERLGRMLPSAIMAALIVYCLKDGILDITGVGISQLIASLVVIASYKWRHSIPLSIIAGTAVYMLLLRL